MANDVGVSTQLLAKLELGHGDTRLLLIFQLCVLLARYLGMRPSQVWNNLIPPEMYNGFEDVREYATSKLGSLHTQGGNQRAKRRFLARGAAKTEPEELLESISFYRFQQLFARSNYSQVDLSLITGISERRLNYLFAISAEKTGQLSLKIFLRLAAALAPVYGASIRDTAYYLVENDLARLDAFDQARRLKTDVKRRQNS